MLDFLCHHLAFTREKLGDCPAKPQIGYPVCAVGRHRQVTALELVRSLGARLDALEPMSDGKLDCLVIAALEMQELVVPIPAPVAAINRIPAEKVKCSGDIVGPMPCHNKDDRLGHTLADQCEKPPI